jgi:hypothetical protein
MTARGLLRIEVDADCAAAFPQPFAPALCTVLTTL